MERAAARRPVLEGWLRAAGLRVRACVAAAVALQVALCAAAASARGRVARGAWRSGRREAHGADLRVWLCVTWAAECQWHTMRSGRAGGRFYAQGRVA
jgi:hypothetical protein